MAVRRLSRRTAASPVALPARWRSGGGNDPSVEGGLYRREPMEAIGFYIARVATSACARNGVAFLSSSEDPANRERARLQIRGASKSDSTMSIGKQEFYEGAALHLLARSGRLSSVKYEAPFFILNRHLSVLLKYCTSTRTPWGFTFTADEQQLLQARASKSKTIIGLICGRDGVAAVSYDSYEAVAAPRGVAIHIGCRRRHREHYEVSGPDGVLGRKVPPSSWHDIFEDR